MFTKKAKVLKRQIVFDKHKRLVEERLRVSDGSELGWAYLDMPRSVIVAALTDDKKLLVEKLYRYNLKEFTYELPAGSFDLEEGPVAAAQRELLEETEYTAKEFIDLGKYFVLPSETNRWTHYFLALGAAQKEESQLDNLIEKYFEISFDLMDFEEVAQKIGTKDSPIKGVESGFGIYLVRKYLYENS